jgi:hypothetical protein
MWLEPSQRCASLSMDLHMISYQANSHLSWYWIGNRIAQYACIQRSKETMCDRHASLAAKSWQLLTMHSCATPRTPGCTPKSTRRTVNAYFHSPDIRDDIAVQAALLCASQDVERGLRNFLPKHGWDANTQQTQPLRPSNSEPKSHLHRADL